MGLWFHGGLALLAAALPAGPAGAPGDAFAALDATYTSRIQPLVKQYCLECHATDVKEGELDLQRFAALADARAGLAECLAMMIDHELSHHDVEGARALYAELAVPVAEDVYGAGAAGIGLLTAAFGVGAVLGAVLGCSATTRR